MFRTTKLGSKWYALQVDEIDDEELENLNTFISEGSIVILSDSLDTVQEFLDGEEIEIVDKDDDE